MQAPQYLCELTTSAGAFEATAEISTDCLRLRTATRSITLDYSQLLELRLPQYRLQLTTTDGQLTLSKLGHDTEAFFEKLWQAYCGRTIEALFVQGSPLLQAEGFYHYHDRGGESSGTAKVSLYEDCICLVPHGCEARRIPLCFALPPDIDGYTLHLRLDTDEVYTLQRLGRDTAGFCSRLMASRDTAIKKWRAAEQRLYSRLSEAEGRAQILQALCGKVTCGLFSPDSPDFWFVGCRGGLAVVELVSGEDTAAYCYRMDCPQDVFIGRLRHAMEAMELHRELIYCSAEVLQKKPLYLMAEQRNPHLRFLRASFHSRLIHNAHWETSLKELFAL